MTTLGATAKAVLRDAGITPREWIAFGGWLTPTVDAQGREQWVPGTEWRGDVCGCTDDRCVGYHHGENERCGCLDALIEQRARLREAHAIWADYHTAVEANDGRGDPDAYDLAWERAEAWVRRYSPAALTFSLDTVVNGGRGISVTYSGTDPGYVGSAPEGDGWRMLVWSADVDEDGHLRTSPDLTER